MTKYIAHTMLALALCVVGVGCAGTEEKPADPTIGVAEWWDNPGEIKDHLAVVGVAKRTRNLSLNRRQAEVDGRAQLLATLRANIQQLVEDWAKTTGDLSNENTIADYVNAESFTRQHLDDVIAGSRAMKYKTIDGNVFCLMVLEDPVAWQNNVDNSVRDAILKDETMFKTQVMKDDFEKKMNALSEKNGKMREQQKAEFDKRYGDGS